MPESEIIEYIRTPTHTGVPCGDDNFVRKISGIIKRELIARERGRPRKIQH
ncbi:MAG: hypothetical protein ABIG42_03395 [bacterium]